MIFIIKQFISKHEYHSTHEFLFNEWISIQHMKVFYSLYIYSKNVIFIVKTIYSKHEYNSTHEYDSTNEFLFNTWRFSIKQMNIISTQENNSNTWILFKISAA